MGNHRPMSAIWSQTITVSGLAGDPAYTLHCEPEGAEHLVEPGDAVTFEFRADQPHGFEISRIRDGLILCRLGDSEVIISDKRGRDLSW